MASPSTPVHHRNRNRGNLNKSHFQRTVCLSDWWLVMAEDELQGRRLAVAGFTSREKQAMRVFSSAPILKRYDLFTVETSDGICVILNGFINKIRTAENGFPSDVYNHFIFGFPPYWKEYDKKFVEVSSSKETSGVNLLEEFSPQSRTTEGWQPHIDSHEKDFGSKSKINAKSTQKSKKIRSSAVPFSVNYTSVIGVSEDNLSIPRISSEGLEKESCSGHLSVEGRTTPELPLNCLKNNMKSLSDSSYWESINASEGIAKDPNSSQNCGSGGILSSCHLYNLRSRNMETDKLRKVVSNKNNSSKTNFSGDMSSSEEILSSDEVRLTTHMENMNNQTSARISGGQKIRLNSVSSMGSKNLELAFLDHEPGGRNNGNFEFSGFSSPINKTQLRFGADPVEDGFEQVLETPDQDKDMRKIKIKSNIQKAKNNARKSFRTPASADNQTVNVVAVKNSYSKAAESLDRMTRRKAYVRKENPEREKEKIPSGLSESLSFKRSRSGRLLMPTLEFWRNQRAIYDSDRTVTGIGEGLHSNSSEMKVNLQLGG